MTTQSSPVLLAGKVEFCQVGKVTLGNNNSERTMVVYLNTSGNIFAVSISHLSECSDRKSPVCV